MWPMDLTDELRAFGDLLRRNRVLAGMQVNDWDAIEDVRRLVGHDVDPAALRDESTALSDVKVH